MFGGGNTQAQHMTVASGVTIQSSCYSNVVPVVYGQTRITGNLLTYFDFQAIPVKGSGSNGGKGGSGGSGSTTYDYKASFLFGLCEGTIGDVVKVWASKKIFTLAQSKLSISHGDLGQVAWGQLPVGQSLSYSGIAHAHVAAYDLGSSAQIPNLSYEVTALLSGANGTPDADPAAVINDALTNAKYGVGFPAARILSSGAGSSRPFGVFSDYCLGVGLLISPAFTTQSDAASQLNTIAQSCNSEFVWSGKTLDIVPYGDENVGDYVAPSAPLFSLTDNDFLGDSQDPVQCTRARPSDQMNSIRFEFLARARGYNSSVVEAKNQAAIEAYGLRSEQPESMHHFCDATAAKIAATLKLQRQSVRNVYSFMLGWKYCVLDPMDIVAITDEALGLDEQWVRILSMEEDDGGKFKITAEEYLGGTGHAPLYDYDPGTPYEADYNVDPGNVTAHLIFEPLPLTIAAKSKFAPHIMVAACGGANWGGCEVWVSTDNATYQRLGRVTSPARLGTLTATLATWASGPTVADTTNTLSVDLSVSGGVLHSGTSSPAHSDADALRTLCYVAGEMIAYDLATLTGPNAYDLTYLRRGAHGSTIGAHSSGATFCRMDDTVEPIDLPLAPISYVGVTLYVKLLSYNIYGGGLQDIAGVSPITFVPAGPGAFVYPPGTVTITTDVSETGDHNWTTELQIGWVHSPDAWFDGYQVQHSVHGANDWRTANVDATTLNHTVRNLPSGTAYDVRVRAVRHYGGPYFSAWVTQTNFTIPKKTTAPFAPTAVSINSTWRTNFLFWTESASLDVKVYNVWRNTTNNFATATLLITHQGTSYLDAQLAPNTPYWYWIVAVDRSGNPSVPSSVLSSTTPTVYDPTNMARDPQFQEMDATGAKLFWTLNNAGTSPVIVSYQNCLVPPSSNNTNLIGALTSVKIVTSNIPANSSLRYGATTSDFIDVTQGQWYRASARALAASGTVNKNAIIYIQWYDASFTLLSTDQSEGLQTGGAYAPGDTGELGNTFISTNGDMMLNMAQCPNGAFYATVQVAVLGGGAVSPAGLGNGWVISKVRMERQVETSRIQAGAVTKHHTGQVSGVALAASPSTTTIFTFTADATGSLVFNGNGTETLTGSASTEYILQVNGSLVLTWQWGDLHLNTKTPVVNGDTVTVIGFYAGVGTATLKGAGYSAIICQK